MKNQTVKHLVVRTVFLTGLTAGAVQPNYVKRFAGLTLGALLGLMVFSLSVWGVVAGQQVSAPQIYEQTGLAAALAQDGTLTSAGQTFPVTQGQPRTANNDFDGDGRTDLAVWRGAETNWLIFEQPTVSWGASYAPYNDVIVPGDYDGDGKTDCAGWRGSTSTWYILPSSDPTHPLVRAWGASYEPYFDVPVPGDYDGDGKTDLAVWRTSTGTWYVIRSSDNSHLIEHWGLGTDTPVPADYDGDGKTDIAVWRGANTNWYIKRSLGGIDIISWGASYAPYFDVPVPADYDGDGKADLAVWRRGNGVWYIHSSVPPNNPVIYSWGLPDVDVPVPGDYDGDGKADIAVWRSLNGTWAVIRSTNGSVLIQRHGQQGDTPVPTAPR